MTRILPGSRRLTRSAVVFVVGVSLLAIAGCATHAKVTASNEIATAQFAIRDARANGAETYAHDVLKKSEILLEEAKKNSGAEAERIAESALANAQLANTIAQRESARKQLLDAQSIDREAGALRKRTTSAVEERLQ